MDNNTKFVYYLEVYTSDSFEQVGEYSGSALDLLTLAKSDEFGNKFGNTNELEFGVSISGPKTSCAPEGYYGYYCYQNRERLVKFLQEEVDLWKRSNQI